MPGYQISRRRLVLLVGGWSRDPPETLGVVVQVVRLVRRFEPQARDKLGLVGWAPVHGRQRP